MSEIWSRALLLVPGLPTVAAMPARWPRGAALLATLAILAVAPYVAHGAAGLYAQWAKLGQAGRVTGVSISARLMTHEAIYVAAFNLTIIALTWLAARHYGARAVERLALGPPPGGAKAYALGLTVAVIASLVWFGPLIAFWPDRLAEDIRPYRELMDRERSWLMPPLYCFLAPVAEEFLFRGFLFRALVPGRLGWLGASVITSALWSVLHVQRVQLAYIQLLLMGILFGWLVDKTGSLRIPILCHVLFNTVISLVVIVWQWPPVT